MMVGRKRDEKERIWRREKSADCGKIDTVENSNYLLLLLG
jgi:hypothetical protein